MKLVLLCLVFVFSSFAYSQKRVVSIDAFDMSYGGGLAFKHNEGRDNDWDESNFRLNLNYAQNWEQYVGLMWKAQVHYNRSYVDYGHNDSFESAKGLAGGVLYNFDAKDIKNSFLASAIAGVEHADYEFVGAKRKSGFNVFLLLEAGKRWDLGQYSVANISYAPTVSLGLKRYGGDIRKEYYTSGREIRFNFLKFDILF